MRYMEFTEERCQYSIWKGVVVARMGMVCWWLPWDKHDVSFS